LMVWVRCRVSSSRTRKTKQCPMGWCNSRR
jgi:hypothetical protein